jgi:hypothetical protein
MRKEGIAAAVAVLLSLAFQGPAPTAAAATPAVDEERAIRIAEREPEVVDVRRGGDGVSVVATEEDGRWEVVYYEDDERSAAVVVDAETAEVRETWTGYQASWRMARGYSGAFGHKLNAPYVFVPLCAIFLLGLVDWRRRLRAANLDLLVLIGFGASHFFFNRAEIGISVPIVYPLLAYLAARALWIGIKGRGEGLRPVWPATWLLIAALFLIGFRVGLNIADSGAIDVGYAGVVGADRIAHGEPIYGNFPADVSQGDTYGPVNYLAYVPAEAVWPWSGSWDDLPAAHGAAVLFDLATFALLYLFGRRLRRGEEGRRLGATLAFGWAAYPYTAYALESNSNDTLVALLVVATLLALARPAARGFLAALTTLTKFAPALLVPMLATYSPPSAGGEECEGVEDGRHAAARRAPSRSSPGPAVGTFLVAFIATTAALMLWPSIDPGLATFYERTIAYQADRDSPFSIWGQTDSLEPLRLAILAATGLLSLAFAFRPRRKSLVQVAALGAALLLCAQLAADHWFYLYIVWFYAPLLVALAAVRPAPGSSPARSRPPGLDR